MITIRSRGKKTPDIQYYLEKKEGEGVKRVILQRVSQEKYLRITIDEHHILEKVKKQIRLWD